MNANLKFIFWPRSIAVIGASTRSGSVGQATFANILMNGYTGIVYPVNPSVRSVLGVKAYPSVLHIPDEVDLAVIIVPASSVPMIIEECGQKNVKGAIIITAGFKEIGESGAKLEYRIKEIAAKHNLSLIGPNCFGMINSDQRVRLNATFGKALPPAGNIAFVSQSGAVGVTALEYAESEGIGLSKFISIGNKADINENELLEYLRDDEQTKVIILYLEDIVYPKHFMDIAYDVTSNIGKPILAIKSGRTVEGAKAASSHTGALAGSDEAYNAFMHQCGIIRVDTVSELFDYAKAFSGQPIPKSRNIAIITNAGGIGIMATDSVIRNELYLSQYTEQTKQKLREFLPASASINNPLDVIGDSDEKRYAQALKLLLEDENVDGVITIWTPTLMAETKIIAQEISKLAPNYSKPIMGCLLSLENTKEVIQTLWQSKIPYYPFPETAAQALADMCSFYDWTQLPKSQVKVFDDVKKKTVEDIIKHAQKRSPVSILEFEGYKILNAYKIPVLPNTLVKSKHELIPKAKEIGYPIVMKIVSPDILHKTDVGGVAVDITSDDELVRKFNEMQAKIKELKPDAKIEGYLLQKMAERGVETIMGIKKDPQFGSLIMFGLGGIYVEVLKDVSFRICPIKALSAIHMIQDIKSYRILKGFRGKGPADVPTIEEALQRLSQLTTDFPEFTEIDINPFVVYEKGNGAFAIDARFLL
ncbi:MAG: acetate--CoA ligase family protein [Candidatus Latescibacteria bacterium]|nr:acetate--CoA ligase family protein [Candidatus Latescibacterota bacterium]